MEFSNENSTNTVQITYNTYEKGLIVTEKSKKVLQIFCLESKRSVSQLRGS